MAKDNLTPQEPAQRSGLFLLPSSSIDSTGNDEFYSDPFVFIMRGNDYLNQTNGYTSIRAPASQFGDDSVAIPGSDNLDQFLRSGKTLQWIQILPQFRCD